MYFLTSEDNMLPNLSSKKPALEVIDFQKDDFGVKLEAIISIIVSKIKSDEYDNANRLDEKPEIEELTKLIFKRLGLKVEFITNEILAAIIPFYSNKNHIFLHQFWRGGFQIDDQDKILKKAQDKEGSVDLAKAKLGGIFSEYTNKVHMHFHALVKDLELSPAEITGVLLHELGHGFYICEYSDRLESINQVLSNVATEVLSKKKKDLKYVYRELEKINPEITEAEVEVLLGENRVIAGTKWFEVIVGSVKYQLGNAIYDDSSFEQLADNFPSRFGYGRPVLTGLDKLHRYFGDPSKSMTSIRVTQTLALLVMIGGVALIAAMLIAAFPVGLLYAMLAGLIFRMSGRDLQDGTYDELKRRYLRLRNDAVEQLKTDKLDKALAKSVLEDIYLMDSVIKETHDWSTVFSKLSNLVFSNARRAKASEAEQQQLEDLLSNDMFVKAAQLRIS